MFANGCQNDVVLSGAAAGAVAGSDLSVSRRPIPSSVRSIVRRATPAIIRWPTPATAPETLKSPS
jgi:hypothetical protein